MRPDECQLSRDVSESSNRFEQVNAGYRWGGRYSMEYKFAVQLLKIEVIAVKRNYRVGLREKFAHLDEHLLFSAAFVPECDPLLAVPFGSPTNNSTGADDLFYPDTYIMQAPGIDNSRSRFDI
jgi:hypothetical protein